MTPNIAKRPAPYRSLSGPSAPECPTECPRECSENGGVQGSVPRGVPGALRAPGRSVQKVSRECLQSVQDTFLDTMGTLSGHFLDTPEPGARRVQGHPVGHSLGHPRFRGHPRGYSVGHSRGHSVGHSGRDSCRGPGASQT